MSGLAKGINLKLIDDAKVWVYNALYQTGYKNIFCNACQDTDIKKINAVVIGMGKLGTEMVKALSWFCQMDGFLANIDAFDIADCAKEKFVSQCPELMKFSGKVDIEGEAKYTINIRCGIDVSAPSFYDTLKKLPRATYVFIALGDSQKNTALAERLNAFYKNMGYNPVIQTNICNKSDLNWQELEEAALNRHLKACAKEDFWRKKYNYTASVAAAVHRKMKILCGISGIEKPPSDRTEKEIWDIRVLEHCRWNAYTRSEGYVYGPACEGKARDEDKKTHSCLVPFHKLPFEEQIKDDD